MNYLTKHLLSPSLLTIFAFLSGACSVLNSFDELDTTPPTDGSGGKGSETMGGASSGGGESMGGSSSGGSTNMGTGGNDATGGGTADPGLIVVMGTDGATIPTYRLSVLSPQTGEELAGEEAYYQAIAYEEDRDIWYLFKGDAKDQPGDDQLIAARFDRVTNEWTILSSDGPKIPVFHTRVFAMKNRLVIGDSEATAMYVLDTTDPTKISILRDDVPFPKGKYWDAVSVSSSSLGGEINFLTFGCFPPTDNSCVAPSVILTRVSIGNSVVEGTPKEVLKFSAGTQTTSARGSLDYNSNLKHLVVAIPSTDGSDSAGGDGQILRYTTPGFAQVDMGAAISFPQPHNQIQHIAFDPCQSSAYIVGPFKASLVGIPTEPELPIEKPLGFPYTNNALNDNGTGIIYEPYTQSMLLHKEGTNFGIDAWKARGSTEQPSLKARGTVEWNPPALRPIFIAVRTSSTPICN